MLSAVMSLVVPVAVFAGAELVRPSCETTAARVTVQSAPAAAQVSDTATVRFKISGMT